MCVQRVTRVHVSGSWARIYAMAYAHVLYLMDVHVYLVMSTYSEHRCTPR